MNSEEKNAVYAENMYIKCNHLWWNHSVLYEKLIQINFCSQTVIKNLSYLFSVLTIDNYTTTITATAIISRNCDEASNRTPPHHPINARVTQHISCPGV